MQVIDKYRFVFLLILLLGLFLLFSLGGIVKKNINGSEILERNKTSVEQVNYNASGEKDKLKKQIMVNDTALSPSIEWGNKEILSIVF